MTLSALIDLYIIEQRCRGNTEFTIDYYKVTLKRFLDFCGDISVSDLHLDICQQYYFSLRIF